MKKTTLLITLAALLLTTTTICAQHKVKAFQHLSFSVNVGTLGYGVQLAAPINQHLSLRTGVMMFNYTHDYNYDGVIRYDGDNGQSADYDLDIPMKAKASMVNGLLLADVFPFRNTRFHLTGGFYLGNPDIIKITSDVATRPVEIGDVIIQPEGGRVAAQLETRAFKPYIGLGFGSSVTKKRVGFKFELGAMFHGSPQIVVTEGEVITDNANINVGEELSKFNDFLKDFSVYPVLNFQLNFRAF